MNIVLHSHGTPHGSSKLEPMSKLQISCFTTRIYEGIYMSQYTLRFKAVTWWGYVWGGFYIIKMYISQNVHKCILVSLFVLKDLYFDDIRLDMTLVVDDDVPLIGWLQIIDIEKVCPMCVQVVDKKDIGLLLDPLSQLSWFYYSFTSSWTYPILFTWELSIIP